ncbi:hypothetical protein FB451DRAFT_1062411 [Mycena latifolia]|nr:hypothetical protein FB451DRAFT_1062411 [Mycena latifolia]
MLFFAPPTCYLLPDCRADHRLLTAIPPKVEEAFKNYRYVPYIALSLAARNKAANDEDNMVLSYTGTFTIKGLDRRGEKSINTVDWYAASAVAEERIRFHHGKERGDAFAAHHRIVMDLGRSHSWEIAMEYDVQQRYLAAQDPRHDLTGLDANALTSALILSLPPGCVAATFDISAAYRLTPIRPDQQHALCVFWDGSVNVD